MPASQGRTKARGGQTLIDRHDLVAALDRAAGHQVTIISAPAGSGKTSLLRAWAHRRCQDSRVAFLSVRPDQRDAQLFWLALLGAVHDASGGNPPPPPAPRVNPQAPVGKGGARPATPGRPPLPRLHAPPQRPPAPAVHPLPS